MGEASTCGSCGADIEWVRTVKGRRMPLDVDERADGNIRLIDGVAQYLTPGEGNRVSHFATCPDAATHRRN